MEKKRSGFGKKNDKYEKTIVIAKIIGVLVPVFLVILSIILLFKASDVVIAVFTAVILFSIVFVVAAMTSVIDEMEDKLRFKKVLLKSFYENTEDIEVLFLGSSLINTDFENFKQYFQQDKKIKWYARLRKNSNGETEYVIIVTALLGEGEFPLKEKAEVDPDYFFEYFKLKLKKTG